MYTLCILFSLMLIVLTGNSDLQKLEAIMFTVIYLSITIAECLNTMDRINKKEPRMKNRCM